MAHNSNHEDEGEGGFGGVEGAPDYIVQSPNQSLQAVSHPIGFDASASANGNSVRISSGIADDGQVERTISSNPKASKKKNGYHHRQGVKKQRLIWTPELHQYFLEIHNRLPNGSKVFPKKILEQMREKFPFVTRENVASHLQKHRLFLKKKMNKENSAKSSSNSVPLKVPKESNSQPIHNNTTNSNPTNPNPNSQLILQSYFNSTNPNSQLLPPSHSNSTSPNSHLILQSHSNSTNPNSQLILQSHFNSTNPNSHLLLQSYPNSTNLLLPRHSNSTNPNSHLPQPKEPHIKPETLLNHEVYLHFDQTNNVSNQAMMQQQQPSLNMGPKNIYSNMINVCESQENLHLALPIPIRQSSIAATTDIALSINFCPTPISANQISKTDGNNNGNGIGFHPTTQYNYNSSGGLNNSNNDNFRGALPNCDYNMNLNFDNLQVDGLLTNDVYCLGSCSEASDIFDYPSNFNAINDVQMVVKQGLQSIIYPSENHMKDDSTLQHCSGSYNNHSLPQTSVNPENQWVEQQSNFTRKKNEYFPSKVSDNHL